MRLQRGPGEQSNASCETGTKRRRGVILNVIRAATPADLPRIIDLFANANDAPYDLRVVADEKCFGAGVRGEPEVRVYGDFAGVGVTCGPYLRILAIDRRQRRRGIGSALLQDAEWRGAR